MKVINTILAILVAVLIVGTVAIPLVETAGTGSTTTSETLTNSATPTFKMDRTSGTFTIGSDGTVNGTEETDWWMVSDRFSAHVDGGKAFFNSLADLEFEHIESISVISSPPISGEFTSSAYILADNTLYATGKFADHSTTTTTFTQIATDVKSVMVSTPNIYYITTDGDLFGLGYAFGLGAEGSFNDYIYPPVQVATGVIKAISDGTSSSSHVAAYLTEDNTLWATGVSSNLPMLTSTFTQIATGVLDFDVTSSNIIYLQNDGALYGAGSNNLGQLGTGNTTAVTTFTQIATGVVDFELARNGSTLSYLDDSGNLKATGRGIAGISTGEGGATTTFTQIATGVVDFELSYGGTGDHPATLVYTDSAGDLYARGYNYYRIFGTGTSDTNIPDSVMIASDITKFVLTSEDLYTISSSGILSGIGFNRSGQLGTGNTTAVTTFTQIATGVADVVVSSVGSYFWTFYITTDGTLYGAGYNDSGQLGTGNTTTTTTFTQIATGLLMTSTDPETDFTITIGNGRFSVEGYEISGTYTRNTLLTKDETGAFGAFIVTSDNPVYASGNSDFYVMGPASWGYGDLTSFTGTTGVDITGTVQEDRTQELTATIPPDAYLVTSVEYKTFTTTEGEGSVLIWVIPIMMLVAIIMMAVQAFRDRDL